MIPDVSQALAWLEKHPQALKGIQRGLERETLRVNADGTLATTGHPEALGSALTHKWITTDFAEALLEFITPVDGDIEHMLTFMRDLHRYTARNMGDERMWPLSMPCYIAEGQDIELAQYGTSNTGRFKTLYREGLKNRYGALMQTISGVHYNFSLPMPFWQAKCGDISGADGKEKISVRRVFPATPQTVRYLRLPFPADGVQMPRARLQNPLRAEFPAALHAADYGTLQQTLCLFRQYQYQS